MSRIIRSCRLAGVALAAAAWLGAAPGSAAEPAAIVEDVQGAVKDVQPFDYVAAGTRIELPARAVLVLGYLKSCARETITGGKVVIGDDQSTVEGGKVDRQRVECDGGRMHLTTAQASKSGAMVFRGAPKPTTTPQPSVTVYGVSPIFTGDAADRLEIKRLDQSGQPPFDFPIARKTGRGLVFDLAKQNVALAPGGLYQASTAGHSVVFKVDPAAQPGAGPAVGRLVRLP